VLLTVEGLRADIVDPRKQELLRPVRTTPGKDDTGRMQMECNFTVLLETERRGGRCAELVRGAVLVLGMRKGTEGIWREETDSLV